MPNTSIACSVGTFRLYRLNKDGREADIRICGPGDTFAECLLAMGDTYLYNAQAAETVTLARFDLQKVRALAEQEKDVAKTVMRCLSDHLRATMDCIANDRLQTAPQRVAHYLLTACNTEAAPPLSACPSRRACSPASWVWHQKLCPRLLDPQARRRDRARPHHPDHRRLGLKQI